MKWNRQDLVSSRLQAMRKGDIFERYLLSHSIYVFTAKEVKCIRFGSYLLFWIKERDMVKKNSRIPESRLLDMMLPLLLKAGKTEEGRELWYKDRRNMFSLFNVNVSLLILIHLEDVQVRLSNRLKSF